MAVDILQDQDRLSDRQIARQVKINPDTLYQWKHQPEFEARVLEIIARRENEQIEVSIRNRNKRVARANRDWLDLQRIKAERAADPAMDRVPGGTTGLLIRRVRHFRVLDVKKVTMKGKVEFHPIVRTKVVEEYGIDAAMIAKANELEEHAARDLGQWGNKVELEVEDHGEFDGWTEEGLAEFLAVCEREQQRQAARRTNGAGPSDPAHAEP